MEFYYGVAIMKKACAVYRCGANLAAGGEVRVGQTMTICRNERSSESGERTSLLIVGLGGRRYEGRTDLRGLFLSRKQLVLVIEMSWPLAC